MVHSHPYFWVLKRLACSSGNDTQDKGRATVHHFFNAILLFHALLWVWCCVAWRERVRRVPCLFPALQALLASMAAYVFVGPSLSPRTYFWLFLILGVFTNLMLGLVMAAVWWRMRPPVWATLSSVVVVGAVVVMFWHRAALARQISIGVLAIGMALSLAATLGGNSPRNQGLGRADDFVVAGLSIFFSVQFIAESGLITFLIPFQQVADVIVPVGSAVSFSVLAWGLRTQPAAISEGLIRRRLASIRRHVL